MQVRPNETFLRKTLRDITKLDIQKVECQYQIASMLTAIRDHKLWEYAEYESFAHMVAGELEFAPSTAGKYVKFYSVMTELGYKKDETLTLMQKFGRNRLLSALDKSDKKLGVRAIAKRISAIDDERDRQFHFAVSDKATEVDTIQVLSQFGMETLKSGQRKNMSSAFSALIADYKRLKKQSQVKTATKTKLKRAA